MTSLLHRLVNAGLKPDDDLWFQFRIRFINQFSLLCLLVSAPWHIILNITGEYQILLVIFIAQLLFATVILLNHRQKFVFAKLLSISTSSLSAFLVTYLMGFQSGFFLYYYSPPFFLYLFFDLKKEKLFLALTAIIYMACITTILLFRDSFPGAKAEEVFFLGLNVFSWNLIFSIMLLFFLFYNYTQFQSELNDSLRVKQEFLIDEIARRTESEESIQKLFKDLTGSYKSLEQFSFIVSHNMRSPLANLKGLSLLFQKDNAHNELLIENIQKAINRLDTVLYDLNDLLNIKQEILTSKETIKLSQALDYCKKSLIVEIEKTDARIEEKYDSDIEIYTIKSIFHSILVNIIQNAIKYKKENEAPLITICAYIDNNQLHISIQDNGVGIDSELYGEKMFRLYSRFHPDIEGKGIGLHLVKTQLDLIGGSISVYSKPNQGCKISLDFNL